MLLRAEFFSALALPIGFGLVLQGGPDAPARAHAVETVAAVSFTEQVMPIFEAHCTECHGELNADSYNDDVAGDSRIDTLRDLMEVRSNERFTRDYFDPDKRGIANALEVFFRDGSSTGRVEIRYPIGHRRRRDEGLPLLVEKFRKAIAGHFDAPQAQVIEDALCNQAVLERMPVGEFVEGLVRQG